jgi:DNA-directed RNA polymerase subunit N (RpoN/RPB10)
MGLFKKLSRLLAPPSKTDERAYWLYVRCSRCGEKIKSRVDLYNDLSPIYNETGVTYFCRKVLIGQQHCYQKIEVEMSFDGRRQLTDHQITGGTFITEEEFNAG